MPLQSLCGCCPCRIITEAPNLSLGAVAMFAAIVSIALKGVLDQQSPKGASALRMLTVGGLAGTLECFVTQPTVYWKNMVQVGPNPRRRSMHAFIFCINRFDADHVKCMHPPTRPRNRSMKSCGGIRRSCSAVFLSTLAPSDPFQRFSMRGTASYSKRRSSAGDLDLCTDVSARRCSALTTAALQVRLTAGDLTGAGGSPRGLSNSRSAFRALCHPSRAFGDRSATDRTLTSGSQHS